MIGCLLVQLTLTLLRVALLGRTLAPRCRPHLSTTWAGVFFTLSATALTSGKSMIFGAPGNLQR